jgi:hypothetical protein
MSFRVSPNGALRPMAYTVAVTAAVLVLAVPLGAFAHMERPRPSTGLAACSVMTLKVMPGFWSPGCTSGYGYLHLSWKGWGTKDALANGQVTLDDCNPSCAEGTTSVFPARLLAFHPKPCPPQPGIRQYMRVRASTLLPAGTTFGEAGWQHRTFMLNSSNCQVSLPVFEQGTGIVLEREPRSVDARRNIYPGSISGLDRWAVGRWRHWDHQRATGAATYWWHTPDGSNFRRFPSRLMLSGMRRCGGTYIYTRIRGVFLGAHPPHMGNVVSLRAYRAEC